MTLRTGETMMDGPINHIYLMEDLVDNAAAKISKMVFFKETTRELFLEMPNVWELVETVPE
jgi:hypothetical protein